MPARFTANLPTAVPTTRSLFRSSAIVSGLVSNEQLEDVLAEILAADNSGVRPEQYVKQANALRDETLATRMVEMGIITRYQADQLLNGRTRFNLGSYIITEFIGRGGMGDVFKAEHNLMGREVAVKVLPRPRSTPEAEANFQREIRLQAKLDHPNLVRAYDAGHDGNVYYLVVEYVPGTDLRRLVRTQGKLDMQQSATVVMQAAKGLQHAHAQGLIHRDVKPGNLLVTPDGHTKVSDLGLAGFMDEGRADPRAGKIVGTADYIAPEVYKSPDNVSPLSDIYSLGCTLYYALTGKVPYPGGTTREKLERHCHDTPYHPQRFNEEVSEEFVEVIADMMEKDPDSRMQTAAEAVARLSVWAEGEGPVPRTMRSSNNWMPPPLPTDNEMGDGADFEVPEDASQVSQGTFSIAGQETYPGAGSEELPPPPVLTTSANSSTSPWPYILITAAIAVPVALCIGGAIMLLFLRLMSGS